jgi:hypothetical protein
VRRTDGPIQTDLRRSRSKSERPVSSKGAIAMFATLRNGRSVLSSQSSARARCAITTTVAVQNLAEVMAHIRPQISLALTKCP